MWLLIFFFVFFFCVVARNPEKPLVVMCPLDVSNIVLIRGCILKQPFCLYTLSRRRRIKRRRVVERGLLFPRGTADLSTIWEDQADTIFISRTARVFLRRRPYIFSLARPSPYTIYIYTPNGLFSLLHIYIYCSHIRTLFPLYIYRKKPNTLRCS